MRAPYPSQPNSGQLPSMRQIGPPDLRPSSTNTPHQDIYNISRGRYLGALGQASSQNGGASPELPSADPNVADYPNELNTLAEADDASGNGIFDAPGSHGNVHPDSGVFADHQSLPGYIARERFFRPSEVRDVNTGEPVMYVPGNAFMVDPRTPWMMQEASLYEPGWPSTGGQNVSQRSTVVPDQPAWPVKGLGAEDEAHAKRVNMTILAAVGGLSVGLLIGAVSKRRR